MGERTLYKREVGGSNPSPAMLGLGSTLAQLFLGARWTYQKACGDACGLKKGGLALSESTRSHYENHLSVLGNEPCARPEGYKARRPTPPGVMTRVTVGNISENRFKTGHGCAGSVSKFSRPRVSKRIVRRLSACRWRRSEVRLKAGQFRRICGVRGP